ncbi:MAG: sensor histidine kinase [Bacteroidota bacterium]
MKTKSKVIGLLILFFLIVSCQKSKDSAEYKSEVVTILKKLETSESDDNTKEITLDTLSQFLLAHNNDSINRNLILEVANNYYNIIRFEKYYKLTNKLYHLSIEKKDTILMARTLYYLGDYYNNKSVYDSAFSYYNKSEKLYKIKKDTLMLGTISFLKGGVIYNTGNFAESETEAVKAMQLLSKTENTNLIYHCYNLIALSLKGLNDYKKSLDYFNLALRELNKENFSKEEIIVYKATNFNNIGRVYEKMGNYSEAVLFYNKGLQVKDLKKQSPREYTMLLDNLAYSKMKSEDFKDVLNLLNESSKLSDSLDRKQTIASNKINYGEYFFLKKDTLKGLAYTKEGLALARKIKNNDLTLQSLKLLSDNDIKNRKFYTDLYIKVSDSMQTVERITRNKFARIAYETDQVEEKNEVLSKRNTYIIIGSAIILFLLGGFFVIYRLKARNKELLFIKEQQEANEKIYQLMLRQQSETEHARNEERNRIAMELHDGIVNSIFTTRFNLIQLEPGALDKKQQLVKELERAENEIRRVSHDLKQNLLFEDQTVPEMITNLVTSQQNQYNTKFDVSIDKYIDWTSVSSNAKIQVYRIIQEALQNSNKYSKAENCCVFLLKTGDKITIRIWDNGIGFNPEKSKPGIGLKNIKERAKAINGIMNITSAIGNGTTIEIVF